MTLDPALLAIIAVLTLALALTWSGQRGAKRAAIEQPEQPLTTLELTRQMREHERHRNDLLRRLEACELQNITLQKMNDTLITLTTKFEEMRVTLAGNRSQVEEARRIAEVTHGGMRELKDAVSDDMRDLKGKVDNLLMTREVQREAVMQAYRNGQQAGTTVNTGSQQQGGANFSGPTRIKGPVVGGDVGRMNEGDPHE